MDQTPKSKAERICGQDISGQFRLDSPGHAADNAN